MILKRIYDGRTIKEVMDGREFFTRAEFEAEDATQYVGWIDGDKYRFNKLKITARNLKKYYMVRKGSKLERTMLELMIKNQDKALKWNSKQNN